LAEKDITNASNARPSRAPDLAYARPFMRNVMHQMEKRDEL